MLWEPTELEALTIYGAYLVFRAGEIWVARFRPVGNGEPRGYPIEPTLGHWTTVHTAETACSVHHGRLTRGDTPAQACEWVRRHVDTDANTVSP